MHCVSQRPNLRYLGEPLWGAESLLEAMSFKKATKGMGRVANARWGEFHTAGAAYILRCQKNLQCGSKKSPLNVCWHFPKRLGIFSPNFTRLFSSNTAWSSRGFSVAAKLLVLYAELAITDCVFAGRYLRRCQGSPPGRCKARRSRGCCGLWYRCCRLAWTESLPLHAS